MLAEYQSLPQRPDEDETTPGKLARAAFCYCFGRDATDVASDEVNAEDSRAGLSRVISV